MLLEMFDEYFDSGVYHSKYHILHEMVEDMRRFGTQPVLNSCLYGNFICT